MSMPRLFTFVGGKVKAVILSIQTSIGASDADKLIATNAQGKLDASFLPAGLGAPTVVVVASENLSAGDYVNIFSEGGVAKARKADAATLKASDGFVLEGVTAGDNATVYPPGEVNYQHSGLTPGSDYFLSLTVPGGVQSSAPSAAGQLYQRLGKAVSATEMQTCSEISVELT